MLVVGVKTVGGEVGGAGIVEEGVEWGEDGGFEEGAEERDGGVIEGCVDCDGEESCEESGR